MNPQQPTTHYSPAEWAKLMPTQRANVLNANRGTIWKISAIESAYHDELNYDNTVEPFEPEYKDDDHTFIDDDSLLQVQHNSTVQNALDCVLLIIILEYSDPPPEL
jgi:hypothetical protein